MNLILMGPVAWLYSLCISQFWQLAITEIQSLLDNDAVDQLFFQDQRGWTIIMIACMGSAPLVLVQLLIAKAKLDPLNRCLLALTDNNGWMALHRAARNHNDPAVLKFLISEHPMALCAAINGSRTPQEIANVNNGSAAITSLLTDATNALVSRNYERIIGLVGPSPALTALAAPARIAFLTSLKHEHEFFYEGDGDHACTGIIYSFLSG